MTVAPSQRQVMALVRNGHRWAPEKPGEPFFFYEQPFWPAYLAPALLGNANLCSPALHMAAEDSTLPGSFSNSSPQAEEEVRLVQQPSHTGNRQLGP